MELKLLLTVLLIHSATVAADYIRPPPRKALHLPWHSQPSSYPQQVTIFITLYSSIKFFYIPFCLWLINVTIFHSLFSCAFGFRIWVFLRKEKEKLIWVCFIFIFKTVINFEHASKQGCSTKKITLKTGWNGLDAF